MYTNLALDLAFDNTKLKNIARSAYYICYTLFLNTHFFPTNVFMTLTPIINRIVLIIW